jgi:transposase InsO family protein
MNTLILIASAGTICLVHYFKSMISASKVAVNVACRHGRSALWSLRVVDEFTRECLSLKDRRSSQAEDVKDKLIRLFRQRGVPPQISSDNAPKFVAWELRRRLRGASVGPLDVQPRAPWESGQAESLGGRVQDELLNGGKSDTFREAKGRRRVEVGLQPPASAQCPGR